MVCWVSSAGNRPCDCREAQLVQRADRLQAALAGTLRAARYGGGSSFQFDGPGVSRGPARARGSDRVRSRCR